MKRRVPYAVGNFEEIVEGHYYFVDKTAYLRRLEDYKVPVFLRPRRFGKSLWCSVLECYYDVNRRERFEELFGNLDIGREPTGERNSYLVMRFNFSKIEVRPDYDVLRENFNSECRNSFSTFMTGYRSLLGEIPLDEHGDATKILAKLLTAVKNAALPPVYLIIDEYDNFTNQLVTTHQDALYREVTTGDSFLRAFFKVIKAGVEDRSIGRVFVTGVLPITIDDLTSGFNIAEIITLAPNTLNMLGFTQEEVERYLTAIFADYGFDAQLKPQILTAMRDFYNGYAFATDTTERVYNSTIITYFLKYFVLNGGKMPLDFVDDNLRTDVNWIKRLASGAEPALALLDEVLLQGELQFNTYSLQKKINEELIFERNFFPIFLFYFGMLTIKDHFHLNLPNRMMHILLTEQLTKLAAESLS